MRQLAVDPHLRVVIHLRLEHDRGAGGIDASDSLRNRYAHAIPVEAEVTVTARFGKSRRVDRLPSGVVKFAGAGLGEDVVSHVAAAARLTVGTRIVEGDLHDARVAIAPLRVHERRALVRREIDAGERRAVVWDALIVRRLVGVRHVGRKTGEQRSHPHQAGDGCVRHWRSPSRATSACIPAVASSSS